MQAITPGAAALRRETYIPGFDWVRLVGSCIVVMSHCNLFTPLSLIAGRSLYLMLSNVVPVFFLMAGYLIAGKLDDREYVAGYVKKYALFYLGFSLLRIGARLVKLLLIGPRSDLAGVLRVLLLLPFKNDYLIAFWFLPALIYGVLVCALLRRHQTAMRVVCALCLGVLVFHALTGRATEVYPIRNIAKGILYVRLGILRREKPIPLLPLVGMVLVFVPFELAVTYLDIAVIALSLLIFEGILRLGGGYLYPYHLQISVFSMLNFFLHHFEQLFLRHFAHFRPAVMVLLILTANGLLTPLLCGWIKMKQKRKKTNGF